MRIRKGDTVKVIAGKDRGKTGKVTRALPREERVVVEGVNMYKKHQRARRAGQQGQVIEKAMPLHVSNVALLDPQSGAPTRVSVSREGGARVRVARKSGAKISG